MSRHVSKADEATSWRRTTALASGDSHHSKQQHGGSGYGGHQRPSTADSALHPHHHQQPEPSRPVQKDFSAAEAHSLLDKRWADVTQQGLQPACQCNLGGSSNDNGSTTGQAAMQRDGNAAQSKPGFLEALQEAVKVNSADAAWDD